MHIDLEQLPSDWKGQSRFCIIGAGIAGLLLALQLAEGGAEVHLLEAGGLTLEDRSQSLYQAEHAATPHTGSSDGRFRTLGGSSTRWGGQLLPYTPDIFRSSPPWLIAEADLSPFYPAIESLMHVGNLPFTDALLPALGHAVTPFSSAFRLRYSKWTPFARRNLAETVGKQCLAHPRITVFTHANVASLEGANGRIASARVLDYAGRSFQFQAEHFIVAAGTVESSRILLSSPVIPNPHDQLGRFFHDHLSFHAAVIPAFARALLFERLGPFYAGGVLLTPKIEATPELQAQAGLLAAMAHLVIQEPEDSGVAAVRNVLTAAQRRTGISKRDLLGLLSGTGDVLRLLWASKVQRRRAVTARAQVWLNIDLEQAPNPDNRIRLSAERDTLGLPKAIVDWRVGPQEHDTAIRYARLLEQEFLSAGFAPLEWLPGLLEGQPPVLADTYHPMGGLRMGTLPAESVVDRDLLVHGLHNLHVASCAVYPTGGSSNPTFTLMALSLRLAQHLLAASPKLSA